MTQLHLFDDGRATDRDNAAECIATVDQAILSDALAEGIRAGWLLSFSSSRDGFALRVSALVDGDRQAVWCEDAASLERALQNLVAAAKAKPAQDAENAKNGAPRATQRKRL